MTTAFETETDTISAFTGQIVHDVFKTMLEYEVYESSSEYPRRADLVTAIISFNGAVKGAVLLECYPEQARLFAGRVMGIPQPASVDGDTRDAMGELVNMIGGNLKSMLPSGLMLSMPTVVENADSVHIIGKSRRISRLSFGSESGSFWVTLVELTA